MSDTVLRVAKTNIIDNPAAVAAKIAALVEAYYSGPEWKRQGPNFIQNTATGQVVNLNQEAVALLQEEGKREDAIAVIADEATGEEKRVFVHQDAVKAAGGDMQVLATRLQSAIDSVPVTSPVASVPMWVWVAGGAVLVGAIVYSSRRGR